jgi:hypothetical protein
MQGKVKTYRGWCHCGMIQFEIKSTLSIQPCGATAHCANVKVQ